MKIQFVSELEQYIVLNSETPYEVSLLTVRLEDEDGDLGILKVITEDKDAIVRMVTKHETAQGLSDALQTLGYVCNFETYHVKTVKDLGDTEDGK